jgi:protease-4
MRACLCFAALLIACKDHPSKLDAVKPPATAGTDLAKALSDTTAHDCDDDKGHDKGKFDFAGMFSQIADTLQKPGRYEAPDASADYDESKPHWGVISFGGGVVERKAFSLFGGHGTELAQVLERLKELGERSHLEGLVLRVESLDISLPDVAELREAMLAFRKTGKKLHCHVEGASNATYLVLTACDRIGMAPLGEVAITGPAAMPLHVRPLLDKLGIEADFLHVGAYKGAAEPLTRDAPSKEMLETLDAILDQRYQTMIGTISSARGIDRATTTSLIDTALFPAERAKEAKLVDEVASFEAFRDGIKAPWTKLEMKHDESSQIQTMMKFARFLGAMPPDRPSGPHIAVVYALGNIVDGDGDGVLGARQEIASHTLVPALRALAADDSVKAVVLRIDSGGGSAQASELIWHAIRELREKKPVIVSMSDVAASGGYYIASGADMIFAQPETLTGSIGVVGGKLAVAGALGKLGVNTFPMGRGKHATLMASLAAWSPEDKATMQALMDSVYNVFVARVAEGRHTTADKIQPIAQGRVWTGAKALDLGLVDKLGGLAEALDEARSRAKLDADTDLEIYPPTPTLRDVLHGFGSSDAMVSMAVRAKLGDLVAAVDPRVAAELDRLLGLVMSFNTSHIQTVAILPEVR